MSQAVKMKPWYRSFSNWLALITIFLGAVVQAMGDGVLPVEGLLATILPAALVILKRMSNENAVTNANAHVEAVKSSKAVGGVVEPSDPA